MNKESLYELQKIDCNCNDCKFMLRDIEKFKKIKKQTIERQKKEHKGNKPFQFKGGAMVGYGNCTKFNKEVSFIPNVCQIETQNCFEHRK